MHHACLEYLPKGLVSLPPAVVLDALHLTIFSLPVSVDRSNLTFRVRINKRPCLCAQQSTVQLTNVVELQIKPKVCRCSIKTLVRWFISVWDPLANSWGLNLTCWSFLHFNLNMHWLEQVPVYHLGNRHRHHCRKKNTLLYTDFFYSNPITMCTFANLMTL